MGSARQNQPSSFTSFTFTDDTDSTEIQQVQAWQHNAGASGNGFPLPLAKNGNQWTWAPTGPARDDINGIYFQFMGASGTWSRTVNVGWSQDYPNRMTGASITCSGGAGQYSIQENVTTPISI